MIDIWQKRAREGVPLSHILPSWLTAGVQGWHRPAHASPRSLQFAHPFALRLLGVPDAPPFIGGLKPGKFLSIYSLEPRPLEGAIGRRAGLAIGRLRLWRRHGRLRLLVALLP